MCGMQRGIVAGQRAPEFGLGSHSPISARSILTRGCCKASAKARVTSARDTPTRSAPVSSLLTRKHSL
jgi:hypothetical protein